MNNMYFSIWSASQLGIFASIVCLIWTLILAIYRLYFHPLARFPGPKIAAATHWYEFYYDILHGEGGQFTFKIDRMHQQYGPIVRINPEEIHIQDPDFHETLYGGPGHIRNKYPPAANHAGTDLGTFGTVDHHTHRQRRAAIAPLFSKKTVLQREHLIKQHIEHLCQTVQRQCSRQGFTELRATYLACTTDVVREYFFGESDSLLDNDAAAVTWFETMDALAFFIPLAKQMGWMIPLSKKLPVGLVGAVNRAMGQAMALNKDMRDRADSAYATRMVKIEATHQEDKPPSDQTENTATLYNEIMSSRLPESEKLPVRMADEGLVVVAAGSETTARTLSTATFHILDNPQSCQKLQDELKNAIPDPTKIPDIKMLEQLPYLSSVVKESLRFSCVPLSRLPIVLPEEPLKYRDWLIPAGTPIAMSTHKIHMDATIYDSPLSFSPERWLSSNSEKVQRMNHHLVPFNKGNRACPGINLAQAQLHLVIATMFRRFDLELIDTLRERDIDPVRDCFLGQPSLASKGVKIGIKRVRD